MTNAIKLLETLKQLIIAIDNGSIDCSCLSNKEQNIINQLKNIHNHDTIKAYDGTYCRECGIKLGDK